ncbi:hypothetical protein SAMN02982917_5959 [Azospirillum oryzae]|uniref:Uncharacterized protein n=1 Tax=Azospirillum oryzae TaxID=286727 RepID=A0A1X7HGR3_9PROT|nr:hypothetical protein [Azospirillum oryzae]SMF86451.1 hypothetical protein SAMN02982917_5959 [Azospirillum oryzae]
MAASVYEVVKEYLFNHEAKDGETLVVRGRVSRNLDAGHFNWDISHHYRPAADALGIYYPSAVTFDNAEEAASALLRYGRKFVSEHGVEPNKFY